mmetsp:Transcript_19013/g.49040  ORF Transcript_19013/g.49040 Transcript_19013/m.49040 type:complete len:223 (+) Transcript_19013:219-887(+)
MWSAPPKIWDMSECEARLAEWRRAPAASCALEGPGAPAPWCTEASSSRASTIASPFRALSASAACCATAMYERTTSLKCDTVAISMARMKTSVNSSLAASAYMAWNASNEPTTSPHSCCRAAPLAPCGASSTISVSSSRPPAARQQYSSVTAQRRSTSVGPARMSSRAHRAMYTGVCCSRWRGRRSGSAHRASTYAVGGRPCSASQLRAQSRSAAARWSGWS